MIDIRAMGSCFVFLLIFLTENVFRSVWMGFQTLHVLRDGHWNDTVLEVLGHRCGRTRYPLHESTELEVQTQTTEVGKLADEGRLACYPVKGKGQRRLPPNPLIFCLESYQFLRISQRHMGLQTENT